MQYRLNHSAYYCHVLLQFVTYGINTPTDDTQKERILSVSILFKSVWINETWKEAVATKFKHNGESKSFIYELMHNRVALKEY
jgi:hypothetical protein